MKLYTKGLLAFLFSLALVSTTFAAITKPPATNVTPQTSPPVPGLVTSAVTPASLGLSSCFDTYRFGSTPAVISTTLSQVSQGSAVAFTGTLTNENNYALIDTTVYVKIFHSRLVNGERTDANGPDVVAFYKALEHVNLTAKESLPLSFVWEVPADAQPGNYTAATFVVTNDRFEMLGLVFTDDVIGNTANFKVVGQDTGAIRFVKDGAIINMLPYHYAAFPPSIPSGVKTVPVSSIVENTTDAPYKGTVTWSLYYWDSVNKSHLLDTKTEEIKVHPHASTTASYVVSDTAHSVYYVEGKLQSKENGSISVIGMRFARSDVNEPRFNFVGISANTAVACIHSSGTKDATDGKVTLTVTSNTWYAPLLKILGMDTLASKTYEGIIPGSISALTAPLTKTASSYRITADLYQNGKHLDSVSIPYSCKDLGVTCQNPFILPLLALGALCVLIALIVFGVRVYKKRMKKASPYDIPSI